MTREQCRAMAKAYRRAAEKARNTPSFSMSTNADLEGERAAILEAHADAYEAAADVAPPHVSTE
jgi:hypothetical protein